MALSVPPFGWWPLAFVGLAVLVSHLEWRSTGRRLACGAAFGLGLYAISLWWATEFTLPGTVVFVALMVAITALPLTLVPPGPGRQLAFPAVIVGTELVRGLWPFGGLPLSGIDLGQSGGPLAPVVALGGRLALVGLTAVAGVALAALPTRSPLLQGSLSALTAAGLVIALSATGWFLPQTKEVGRLRGAVVQGGGARGMRAPDSDPAAVFATHVAASRRIKAPVDLVLWPEDVVDVDRLSGSAQDAVLADLARSLHATVVAGIVEGTGGRHWRNSAVAWGPDGRRVDRYEKVQRVPFGEYFPFRPFLEQVAAIPATDALAGPPGPGLLRTPAGPLGVTISYEVFFQERARAAAQAGGEILLIPTNASSYTTAQMPAQELAAARLRAWQSGRDVLQAAPTGFSAVVDHRGRIRARTDLGAAEALTATVTMRTGLTPYDAWGDMPVVALALLSLLAGWVVELRLFSSGKARS